MRELYVPDDVQPSDPKDEPTRPVQPQTFGEFLKRTRRYHKLTRRAFKLRYAKGLDSKPEEMA